MSTFVRSAHPAPEANIEFRLTQEGGVLVDMNHGTCFGLNRVAAEVWVLLTKGESLGSIIDSLQQRYHADPQTLEADTLRLCDELASAKLLRGPA